MTRTSEPSQAPDRSLSDTMDKLNLSSEEVNKFEKAFKDPEFLKIFEQYAKDVEDPETRKETEMYLQQLEREGQIEDVYGKGTQLITPVPEFVIKTKDEAGKRKVFLNICSSDKVGEPTSKQATTPEGKPGEAFQIPFSTTRKSRKGTDNRGEECTVIDCTVHPTTVKRSFADPRFMSITAQSAIEQGEAVMGCKLSHDFKIPRMKFKGTPDCPDKPCVTALRGDGATSVEERVRPMTSDPVAGALPPGAKPKPAPGAKRSSFKFAQRPKPAATPQEAGFKHPDGCVTPRYQIVHRGSLDLVDAWSDATVHSVPSVPKDLIVRVDLPGVRSAAAVDLEAHLRTLELVVPKQYRLSLPLPFEVRSDEAAAKFDTAKQQLCITLPVVPPVVPQRPQRAAPPPAADVAAGAAQLVQDVTPAAGSSSLVQEVDLPAPGELHDGAVSCELDTAGTSNSACSSSAAAETRPGCQPVRRMHDEASHAPTDEPCACSSRRSSCSDSQGGSTRAHAPLVSVPDNMHAESTSAPEQQASVTTDADAQPAADAAPEDTPRHPPGVMSSAKDSASSSAYQQDALAAQPTGSSSANASMSAASAPAAAIEAAHGNSELLAAAVLWEQQHAARDVADRPPEATPESTAAVPAATESAEPSQAPQEAEAPRGGAPGGAANCKEPQLPMALDFEFLEELD